MTNTTTIFDFAVKSLSNLFFDGAKPAQAITVHDGTFHADDVAAVALIELLCSSTGSAQPRIIRTRDESKFEGLIVDVGEGLFDHHGKQAGTDDDGVPYSGVSRVWEWLIRNNDLEFSRPHQLFKQRVLDPLSKIDNGQALDSGEVSLFTFVPVFNPGYGDEDKLEQAFSNAVRVAREIILGAWQKCQADARGEEALAAVVEEAKTKYVVDVPVGLDSLWPRALSETKAVFVIISAPDGTHYVQCVPEPATEEKPFNAFSKKVALPESWAGKRGEDLAAVCGFNDAVFCHVGRFICGFKSHESAELAATAALVEDTAAVLNS